MGPGVDSLTAMILANIASSMYNNKRGSLLTSKYQAYANYLLKFVQNYESRGIDIYAITPNNEPDHASYDWPALPMYHDEAQTLVADYIYPTFRNAGLDTKIICWDHSYTTTNYPNGEYAFDYYSDADAFAKTDGSAWHWYEGDEEIMSVVRKENPTKDIWFTEGSGGEWGYPEWKTAFLNQSSCVINIARNWSTFFPEGRTYSPPTKSAVYCLRQSCALRGNNDHLAKRAN